MTYGRCMRCSGRIILVGRRIIVVFIVLLFPFSIVVYFDVKKFLEF
jgi:hypothetical protein